ncbi:MAG: hypothetical protein APR54_12145, partial [Candidatus Cloacimonas sp. SDB]
ALQWAAESEKDDVVAYFDPDDDTVTRPPETVPARSWKMSDETKRWVTVGHAPAEQASLLKQIDEAEEKRKMRYIISVPSAYYEIEYGLVKGVGGEGEKTTPIHIYVNKHVKQEMIYFIFKNKLYLIKKIQQLNMKHSY